MCIWSEGSRSTHLCPERKGECSRIKGKTVCPVNQPLFLNAFVFIVGFQPRDKGLRCILNIPKGTRPSCLPKIPQSLQSQVMAGIPPKRSSLGLGFPPPEAPPYLVQTLWPPSYSLCIFSAHAFCLSLPPTLSPSLWRLPWLRFLRTSEHAGEQLPNEPAFLYFHSAWIDSFHLYRIICI